MPHVIEELKRRKVFQVAALYAVVSWLILQIIDVVNEPLKLPDWFDTVAIVSLFAGFPIAMILAWAFDITRQGVVRTPSSGENAGEGNGPEDTDGTAQRVLDNSVAVLPFENISRDPDNAYFAAGIHDEILAQLAKIKALNVIARTSVLQYASGQSSIPEIATALNVGAIMEGAVRYDGNRVRITAQLVAADQNTRLWSETYDRQLDDIFEIQTDIATRIGKALEVELTLGEKESLEKRPTYSTDAYEPFLKAMAIYREGDAAVGVTAVPGKRLGIQDYLDEALALDPEFALAHAWKAWLYSYSRAYDPIEVEDWLSRSAELDALVRRHADRALAANSEIGLAHAAHSKTHLYNWSIADAEIAAEEAQRLSPNDSEVLRWCANIKWFGERQQEAVQLAERAVELDPRNGFYYDLLGRIFHSAGNYDAAANAFRKSIEIDPGTSVNYVSLARPELASGNESAALDALKTAETLLTRDASPGIYADLANGYARLERHDDAKRTFESMSEVASSRYVDPAVWAFGFLAVNDHEKALARLEKLIEKRALLSNPFTVMFIRENAWSDPALDRPDFSTLRDKLSFAR